MKLSSTQYRCAPVDPTAKRTVRDWSETTSRDHFVQFYRTDEYLIECLACYVADGIWNNQHVVIIATPPHRIALEDRIRQKGIDVVRSVVAGQYLALDAREVLAKFMVDGKPDRKAFLREVGGLVRHANPGGKGLRAFGEMVALLWADGKQEAAIELEHLWNDLGKEHAFSLYCAYPADLGAPKPGLPSLEHICDAHSCVISLTTAG